MENKLSFIEEFIKQHEPNLLKVLEVKIKDTDDDFGFINEHYIVKCIVSQLNPQTINYEYKEKTCLVKINEFKNWKNKKDVIKWLYE